MNTSLTRCYSCAQVCRIDYSDPCPRCASWLCFRCCGDETTKPEPSRHPETPEPLPFRFPTSAAELAEAGLCKHCLTVGERA